MSATHDFVKKEIADRPEYIAGHAKEIVCDDFPIAGPNFFKIQNEIAGLDRHM